MLRGVPTKRSLKGVQGVTVAQNATPRRMQSIAGARKQVGAIALMLDGRQQGPLFTLAIAA